MVVCAVKACCGKQEGGMKVILCYPLQGTCGVPVCGLVHTLKEPREAPSLNHLLNSQARGRCRHVLISVSDLYKKFRITGLQSLLLGNVTEVSSNNKRCSPKVTA